MTGMFYNNFVVAHTGNTAMHAVKSTCHVTILRKCRILVTNDTRLPWSRGRESFNLKIKLFVI